MRKWIEEIVEVITFCEYINATEGGVKIRGTKQMTLKEVVDGLKEQEDDWYSILKDPSVHISDQEYEKMMEVLERELATVDEFSKLSVEDIFQTPGYKPPIYFELFRVSLRSRPEPTRAERFAPAMKQLVDVAEEVLDIRSKAHE